MSNLFLPNQKPTPSQGLEINVGTDGDKVVLRLAITIPMAATDASGLAQAIGQAALKAQQFQMTIMAPTNGISK